ncbi:FAD-binding oxidoreductase [Duganella violaceipulchra]|uniref:Alkyldihydroxyacetonephosphate synthase n=1 Tax=Duganella violaceipulchra TaxID=2849652 RepID=A0AA41L1G3_9BURK|nr:FAD-binding oxidoreductase [Duganella violaceicalia]MBV6324746.1 FAD-binding oxidoreductase [Duganella violaceicalia]MCP2009069.1 alkyldihydroxyacetonephosphate synthase [Duganella violaceicalia]
MRRWNGWGDDTIEFALSEDALGFLAQRVGNGTPVADAAFEQACARIAPSRLPPHALTDGLIDGLIDTSAEVRLRNALGQSLPDWLRLRYGVIETAPDGVAYPESAEQVRALIDYAQQFGVALIPQGGGTSVAGHLTAPAGARPVLAVNLTRLRQMYYLDTESQLATFGAGVFGPDLEAQLRARGYTLGHFPQSFEYSTLGGWVVTRSSGQQSLRYGRIEQMFRGGKVETPAGTLDIPTFPASAAGTDLREMVLGSEGRLGILTEATVRVTPLPEYEAFHAVFFPSWDAAEAAVRQVVQAGLSLSMLRLSNPLETTTMLALAGHKKLIGALEGYLSWRGCKDGKCMLMIGVSGRKAAAKASLSDALALTATHGGVHIGRKMGDKWKQNRFRNVYLRNAAWQHGYAIDTVETAVDWPRVGTMMRALEAAATGALAQHGEKVHAYTHLSHLYAQGASVYSTFVYRLAGDYEQDLARWRTLKHAVSMAIVENGGTISHQHGVGSDHAPYLVAEKGELGLSAMRALFAHFDPQQIMNPGKLLP